MGTSSTLINLAMGGNNIRKSTEDSIMDIVKANKKKVDVANWEEEKRQYEERMAAGEKDEL